jgi:chemotaxis protein methyltransferase CheR
MWSLEPHAQFDVVFCRNVLMYFEAGRRERVLRKILTRLPPRGYLFLGDAEGLSGFDGLRMVGPSVHTLKTNPEVLRSRSDDDAGEKAAR